MSKPELLHPQFRPRAAAIICRGESVLLHRLETDSFWALPGGGVEPGETAAATVVRELNEELGLAATVRDLRIVAENFFTRDSIVYHELGLYFDASIDDAALPDSDQFYEGNEAGKSLIFRWFQRSEIITLSLRPMFMRTYLSVPSELQMGVQHVVYKDEGVSGC